MSDVVIRKRQYLTGQLEIFNFIESDMGCHVAGVNCPMIFCWLR